VVWLRLVCGTQNAGLCDHPHRDILGGLKVCGTQNMYPELRRICTQSTVLCDHPPHRYIWRLEYPEFPRIFAKYCENLNPECHSRRSSTTEIHWKAGRPAPRCCLVTQCEYSILRGTEASVEKGKAGLQCGVRACTLMFLGTTLLTGRRG
jgi:hypothetical protein